MLKTWWICDTNTMEITHLLPHMYWGQNLNLSVVGFFDWAAFYMWQEKKIHFSPQFGLLLFFFYFGDFFVLLN